MSEYVCSNRFKITKYRDGEDKTVKFVDCGDVYETDTICDETRGGWIFLKSKWGMPEIGVKPNDFKKNFTKNQMGKPIEKHHCTKCIHGILCESGELKCNHEAWTTTKDGTYAYPNGLRQIKSRDKPSWCPGFKAMQSAGCDEVKKTNAEIGLDKKECEKNSGIFYLTNRIIYELSQISPTSVGPDNSFRLGKCVAMAAEIQRINKENKK